MGREEMLEKREGEGGYVAKRGGRQEREWLEREGKKGKVGERGRREGDRGNCRREDPGERDGTGWNEGSRKREGKDKYGRWMVRER